MNPTEAQAALAESARRQQQTIQAGRAPWPWSLVLLGAATLVALGLIADLNLVWLNVLVIIAASALGTTKGVQLRATRASRGWGAALAATFLLALLADIAVQFLARDADLPLPNTFAAATAGLSVILVSRPVQFRVAASRRPR